MLLVTFWIVDFDTLERTHPQPHPIPPRSICHVTGEWKRNGRCLERMSAETIFRLKTVGYQSWEWGIHGYFIGSCTTRVWKTSRIDVILAAVAVVETELQPFMDCKYSEYVLVEAQFKRKWCAEFRIWTNTFFCFLDAVFSHRKLDSSIFLFIAPSFLA